MAEVKRHYDASLRRARAEETYAAVAAVARERFLADGFAATTVAEVARSSQVSVEYVYKNFGGKAGLLRAVVERALEGAGPQRAEDRSDALPVSDRAQLAQGWGRLVAEVAPLVAPVLLLVRAAAAQDNRAASLADELDAARWERMARNARRLSDGRVLRAGIGVERATDVLWTFSSPELYDLLVVRRGWAADELGDFVARGIESELL